MGAFNLAGRLPAPSSQLPATTTGVCAARSTTLDKLFQLQATGERVFEYKLDIAQSARSCRIHHGSNIGEYQESRTSIRKEYPGSTYTDNEHIIAAGLGISGHYTYTRNVALARFMYTPRQD